MGLLAGIHELGSGVVSTPDSLLKKKGCNLGPPVCLLQLIALRASIIFSPDNIAVHFNQAGPLNRLVVLLLLNGDVRHVVSRTTFAFTYSITLLWRLLLRMYLVHFLCLQVWLRLDLLLVGFCLSILFRQPLIIKADLDLAPAVV